MKNRKTFALLSCITLFCVWLLSCTPQQAKPIALTVSAFVSSREVMTEVGSLYKQEKPNVAITYNFAISRLLNQQIEQGVPADIFIVNSTEIMDNLQAKGLVIPETRQNLMKNSLALIIPQTSSIPISKFQDLTREQVKKVALGTGSKLVLTKYTQETLTSLGIYESVKNKGVFTGEEARQILKAVETKEVDAGITYFTEAKLSNQVKVAAIAPENSHSPIIYPVAILKSCQNVSEAKDFIQFLKSDKATALFEKYGFTMVK